ncbi:P-loop containing nucleoside triphosphate hydrolase protein [Cystobasidium minutum MCA 4210]|uniref:P-loop containing nucleoside triphosphate hydrolase protein n=1 Tax=Cystobasidium minutum MCA 4210 TaxID=1397322 RepID=UPI0034CF705A|eukprot:jgi/Rhomi1/195072/gm1.3286_g
MAPMSSATKSNNTKIEASAQQTRFDPSSSGVQSFFAPSSHNPTRELDIKDITLSVSNKPILADAHLKLLPGVKYLLHGQNGTGKSTVLKAIKEGLIPGVPANVVITLLQQRDDEERADDGRQETFAEQTSTTSALDLVMKSDTARSEAIRKRNLLQTALEDSTDAQAPSRVLKQLRHEEQLYRLDLARKEAQLRSGARGAKARKTLIAIEEEVEASLASLQITSDQDVAKETDEAVQLLAQIEAELEAMSADAAHLRAEELLVGLGFTRTSMQSPLSTLSGGWKMRAHLASALFVPSHILLLDEPTSFLDFSSLLWLEDYLSTTFENTKGTGTILLLVSHDRSFADAVADETIILRDLKFEYFNGNLSAYYTERKKQQIRMGRMKDALDKQRTHMEKTVLNNVKMARKSGDDKKLKQAASRSKKLDERMGLQVSAKGGRFKLNRDLVGYHTSKRAEIEIPKDDAAVKMKIPRHPEALRFPGPLLGCEGLAFTYYASSSTMAGEKQKSRKTLANNPIFQDVNLSFRLGEKIGFVGLNGAGKSTLIACLVGSASLTGAANVSSVTSSNVSNIEEQGELSGSITRHPGAIVGYYSQEAVNYLPADKTALEYISLGTEQASRSALASLDLAGRAVSDVKLSDLSGGQRVRVALAKILFPVTPHVLVLDEVTTHLDADTVQVLAEQLRKYRGTLILVSHDRWFLNAVLGEKPESSDDSDLESSSSDESETDGLGESKEGMVFWVDRGKVKRLHGGVDEFEGKVRKRAEKARRAAS